MSISSIALKKRCSFFCYHLLRHGPIGPSTIASISLLLLMKLSIFRFDSGIIGVFLRSMLHHLLSFPLSAPSPCRSVSHSRGAVMLSLSSVHAVGSDESCLPAVLPYFNCGSSGDGMTVGLQRVEP